MKKHLRKYGKQSPKNHADLKAHFKKRLLERYGIECNKEKYLQIRNAIKEGGNINHPCKFVKTESRKRTHWDIFIDNVIVRVVYNSDFGELVTALPIK